MNPLSHAVPKTCLVILIVLLDIPSLALSICWIWSGYNITNVTIYRFLAFIVITGISTIILTRLFDCRKINRNKRSKD